MAATLFCTRWWFTGREEATWVHLRSEDGREVTVEGESVQRALKRCKRNGQPVFLYRQVRCGRFTVFVSRRMQAMCVLIPRNGFAPPRIVMLQESETLLLREELVSRLDGWDRSTGTINNRTLVTQKVA